MDDALLKEFSSYIVFEKNLSNNTKLAYVRDIKLFLDYCEKKDIDCFKINHNILENYLLALKEGGIEISSIFRKVESIKAFYRFLLISGKIKENPISNFKAPRVSRKLPQFLSESDINSILSMFEGGRFNILRTFVIIDLLYSSGIRISELTELVLESINLDELWIRVSGKGGKQRYVPINKNTAKILKIYLSERELKFRNKDVPSFVFLNKSGKKISRIQVWKDIKKIAREAGIKKNVYPHIFRHSFATHLLLRGADLRAISEMLGHSNLSTTQIYTHLDRKALKEIHRKYHPLDKG